MSMELMPDSLTRSAIRPPSFMGAPVVLVACDDPSARGPIEALLRDENWSSATFSSTAHFEHNLLDRNPTCLLLDLSPLALDSFLTRRELEVDRTDMPFILLMDRTDVATAVRAMKAGALDVLTKRSGSEAVLNAIRLGLQRSAAALSRDLEKRRLSTRYGSLSRREREVMALVVSGLLNKQIGGELGISEITVKAHRGKMMRKMQARSLAGLLQMAIVIRPEEAASVRPQQ